MKKVIFVSLILVCSTLFASAQFKKDGTPDMRYRANKQTHGNSVNSLQGTTIGTNPNVIYQSGHMRYNGSIVSPHYKTSPNATNWDNYSTEGNYNPYNGRSGSKPRDYSIDAYNYSSDRIIYTGPKGGQYYINQNGRKTYVPKR